jgi:hypothetical protein
MNPWPQLTMQAPNVTRLFMRRGPGWPAASSALTSARKGRAPQLFRRETHLWPENTERESC